MGASEYFTDYARVASRRNSVRLEALKPIMRPILMGADPILLMSDLGDAISAHSVPSYRLVVFAERLLAEPPIVLQTVAAHEAVHLRLGSALPIGLAGAHPDVVTVMEKSILPDWFRGRTNIVSDVSYIKDKGWASLYDAWAGPLDINLEKATRALDHYFRVLKLGGLYMAAGELSSLPLRAIEQSPHPIPPLVEAYERNPEEIVMKVATGYELLHYMTECLEAASSIELKADFATLEEAFANYVGSSITGMPLDELQRCAPQDEGKIRLARDMQKCSEPIETTVNRVNDHHDLVAFCRQIGVFP